MKEISSFRPYFKDKKSLVAGVIIGALAASLLWFMSANVQISIFKKWHNKTSVETVVPSVIETEDVAPSVIETGH